MEINMNKYSLINLSNCSYRELQKIAKGMGLPSNVKKNHLTELIHAKKFKSEAELNEIICYVKHKRNEKSAAKRDEYCKKNCIQKSEVSTTFNKSPPITETPKRLKALVVGHTTNVKQNPSKCNAVQSNAKHLKTASSRVTPTASDRVLRSFHERRNYRALNMSTLFDVIKSSNHKLGEVGRGSQGTDYSILNLRTVGKNLTSVGLDTGIPGCSHIVSKSNTNKVKPVNEYVRKITSSISPRKLPERSNDSYIRTMNFIDKNGRMTKLKGLVKKPVTILNKNSTETSRSLLKNNNNNKQGSNVLLRLIRESGVSNRTDQGNVKNTFKVDLIIGKSQKSNVGNENLYGNEVVEIDGIDNQLINEELEDLDNSINDILPLVNNDSGKYNNGSSTSSFMEPIYIQVSEGAEKTQTSPSTYTATDSTSDGSVLEYVYNLKKQIITSTDMFQHVTTTSNTKCVYSTSTITTAIQQPPATGTNELNAFDLSMQDYGYKETLYELLPFDLREESASSEFVFNEEVNSSASLESISCEDLNGTIPEMVEDALELINHDGNYMEHIKMDLTMQCFLCPWFGTKLLLESHFRQYHINEIETYVSEEWVTTYTLGGLVQRDVWSCRVVQCNSVLYVLSAKYEDPDIFLVSINTIIAKGDATKLARITAFNKTTGEPYTWQGLVTEIPNTMPYQGLSGFKLKLSKLNLLPNSSNLRLVNRELVVEPTRNVVVGQPALNDIHINLFIKLSNIPTL